MNKIEYYRTAFANLGALALANLEIKKKTGRNQPMRLTSKYLDHPVIARPNSSDLQVFEQIFSLREYRCLDREAFDGLIIDLGANVGYSAAYFLSQFPKASVIAIEPVADNFAELHKNLAPYHPRAAAVQAAIMPGADYVSASIEPGQEWGATMQAADVGIETITIPEILSMSGKQHIDLLKIDIEGAERQLFEADTTWLDLVETIVIELHGPDCEQAFFDKINKTNFLVTRSDELTVCKRPWSAKRGVKDRQPIIA